MDARRAAMNARLDEKVTAMNAAKGDKKVDAMAEVIVEVLDSSRC